MQVFQAVLVVFLAFLIDVNCVVENSTASEVETESTADDFHCASSPCRNGGTCINEGDTYSCVCPELYGGQTCSENRMCELYGEELCGSATCFFDFERVELNCTCEDGKVYDTLAKGCIVDPCDSNPCKNGGTCMSMGETHRCACSGIYTGKDCSENVYCLLYGWRDCGEATCHYDMVSQNVSCSCAPYEKFDDKLKACKGPCAPNPCKSGEICLPDGSCYGNKKIMITVIVASLGTVALVSILCGLFCYKKNRKLKKMPQPESYQAPRPVMVLEQDQTNLYPTVPRF